MINYTYDLSPLAQFNTARPRQIKAAVDVVDSRAPPPSMIFAVKTRSFAPLQAQFDAPCHHCVLPSLRRLLAEEEPSSEWPPRKRIKSLDRVLEEGDFAKK